MRTIVTTLRNEGPFLLEWLAYHRLIGFTDFLAYSNDCEDGTDAMLDRLAALGLVRHEPNPRSGHKTVQWQALNRAAKHPLVQQAEWVFVTDVDEFLCIHAGAGRLDDLFAACPDARGFAIAWRMFGNDGVIGFTDEPVIGQFSRCAPEHMLWPWHSVQFKSLYRPDARWPKPGVHRPRGTPEARRPEGWVDANGAPMPAYPGPILPSNGPRYGLAQINHYALGAAESFLVKAARGRPNRSEMPIDLAYWVERNHCAVEDTRIQRHIPAVRDLVAEWVSADPELGVLHQAAAAWRRQKIADLLALPGPLALFQSIIQLPQSASLPLMRQQQMLRLDYRATARATREKAAGATSSG